MSKKIVCYGDSNTYGYDARVFGGDRFCYDERWTGILDAMPEYEIENYGVNGREINIEDWDLKYLDRKLQAFEPFDLLTIMLGSNDLLLNPGRRIQDVEERMEKLLSHVCKNYEANKILLIAPVQIEIGQYDMMGKIADAESLKFSQVYGALAHKYGVHFTDARMWDIPLAIDGVHISLEGHRIFAEHMAKVLAEIFD